MSCFFEEDLLVRCPAGLWKMREGNRAIKVRIVLERAQRSLSARDASVEKDACRATRAMLGERGAAKCVRLALQNEKRES